MNLRAVEVTPLQQAGLEITRLSSLPELQANTMIGGPTPPEMEAENERKRAEYARRRREIIARHGVINDYLKPLLVEERLLASRLAEVRREVTELEKLRGRK